VAIELRVAQFWSEIILVISNRTRATRSFDFEIICMISDQIALQKSNLNFHTRCNTSVASQWEKGQQSSGAVMGL